MKTSGVLWEAANHHLWAGYTWQDGHPWQRRHEWTYSCDAVGDVGDNYQGHALAFLRSLGVSCYSMSEFDEFEDCPERQGARYLWLMFAYLVALDEEKNGWLA